MIGKVQTAVFSTVVILDGKEITVEYKTNKSAIRLTDTNGMEHYVALDCYIRTENEFTVWVEAFFRALKIDGLKAREP